MANLKSIKKGDMVTLRMFTGAIVGGFKVEKADAKTLGFTNKKGVFMTFDKKTGKQIDPEPKSDKFANIVTEYDEEEVEAAAKKRATKSSSPAKPVATSNKTVSKKKSEPVEELEDDDFDEDEEAEEPVKPVKKIAKIKKPIKRQAEPVDPEEDEDEDDDFDDDDDEFEEVD